MQPLLYDPEMPGRWLFIAFASSLVILAACASDSENETSATTQAPTTSVASTTSSGPTTSLPPEGFVVDQIIAGDQHGCAVDPDGQAWCWGYNEFGQLGDGTTDDSNVPTAVAGEQTFESLAAGRYFTCGLTDEGAAWCWGDNSRGQLGDGSTGEGSDDQDRSSPVQVLGDLNFTSLVAGQLHVCGLVDTGEAYCWGSYPSGQLGNASTENQTAPGRSAESLTLVSLASGGDNHTCGVDTDGKSWCWGNNTFGQLGNGAKSNAGQEEPSQVSGDQTFTALALGHAHTCGLDDDGAAWCWGGNDTGQLGDGTTDERFVPNAVETELRFVSMTTGQNHTCAVTLEGEAYCWGANGMGQLGDGDDAATLTPVAVAGGIEFDSLSGGEEFTCGAATDATAYCWGSNRSGWLGSGTEEPSMTPVRVVLP
jgi:alpha-tubulin suppressor-like RCC1 family protein